MTAFPPYVRSLKGHRGAINRCIFTVDGGHVVSASCDRDVRLWNPYTGAHVATYTDGEGSFPTDIIVLGGKQQIISSGGHEKPVIWETETQKIIRKMKGHEQRVTCCAVAEGGTSPLLFSGSSDRYVIIWDLRMARPVQKIKDAKDVISGLIIFDPQTDIISTSYDGCLRRYDPRAGLIQTFDFVSPLISTVAAEGDEVVVVLTQGHGLKLIDRKDDMKVLNVFDEGDTKCDLVRRPIFDPEGTRVFLGGSGSIAAWDICAQNGSPSVVHSYDGTILDISCAPRKRISDLDLPDRERPYPAYVAGGTLGDILLFHDTEWEETSKPIAALFRGDEH